MAVCSSLSAVTDHLAVHTGEKTHKGDLYE